ncbi:UPF0489 protein C5orf22-like [Ruditapes philippinarum]|uniref:UPF0489 protein C5orf22-like n=1 Tax=Ruditapes philippinarum TaxID=129788 RepID=UPI00295B4C32|nr:UPF0489 protein C5orf22-like [Ruditapes philippinarum]
MSTMKRYPVLPVVIEEDHHDVLPHIYRSIGSKHLPVKDVTLIHLDSHPDMLSPLNLPADSVYDKQKVFESLSIENWILPAVYAGHISHVLWIKPPWCSQVEDKQLQFFVGKCPKTGTIRTTCTESYFVSETLYVPESQLLNKQLLTFSIFTLKPTDWVDNEEVNEVKKHSNEHKLDTQTRTTKAQEYCDGVHSDTGTDNKPSGMKRQNSDENINNSAQFPEHLGKDLDNKSKRQKCDSSEKSEHGAANADKGKQFCSPSTNSLSELASLLKGQNYVLDIDLDFYSTMNPFRNMYGDKQYDILQELYKFEKPATDSQKDVEKCVSNRQKQLDDLKQVFSFLEKDEKAEIKHSRAELIRTLISDLKATGSKIDYELLHEAGCTCDDTELPHHISSNSQITSLVDSTQDMLSYLPKPTLITIARSSSDDYCPPNQVDMIQDSVLTMLQELYLEISVNMAYKDTDEDDV